MLEAIRKEVKSKLQQVKKEPYLYHYLVCIAIPLLLGFVLKNNYLDGFVLCNLSVSSVDHTSTFSTCATILATIFSILFVLLTVFIQVSDVYVSADIFTERKTLSLVILYFFTIILSLVMLETDIKYPILVLTLTCVCILLLYPFLLSINSKLVFEVGLVKLITEISSLIDSGNESLINAKIIALTKICKRSLKEDRFQEFFVIMSIFRNSLERVKDKKMMEVIRLFGYEYLDILDYCVKMKFAKNNRKTMISLLYKQIQYLLNSNYETVNYDILDSLTYELKEIGKKMIKSDFDNLYINKIIRTCLNVIYYSLQGDDKLTNDFKADFDFRYHLEPDILGYIGELATETYKRKKECSSLSVFITAFFAVGAKTSQLSDTRMYKSPFTRSTVIEQLNNIEKNIGSDCFEHLVRKLIDSVKYNKLFHGSDFFTDPEHKNYLESFKVYYDSNKKITKEDNSS